MRAFQSTYVGRNEFPKSLPEFLLRQWFTLNARDRRTIRKTFRSRHWIGAALQLSLLGMTGPTLRSLEYVPAAVLRRLGRQFKQPAPDIRLVSEPAGACCGVLRREKTAIQALDRKDPVLPAIRSEFGSRSGIRGFVSSSADIVPLSADAVAR